MTNLANEALRRAMRKWGSGWGRLSPREKEEKAAFEFMCMIASWTASSYSEDAREAAATARDIFALVGEG